MSQEAKDLSRSELNLLARQVQAAVTRAGLELALEVGRLLVEAFYGGSVEAARSRHPTKRTSLRRLAEHPDIQASASTLSIYLGVYVQYEQLDPDSARKLPVTAHRALLKVRDLDLKRALARQAATNLWTTRVLKEEILGLNLPRGPGGRPKRPHAAISIEHVAKQVEKAATASLPELLQSQEDVSSLLVSLDRSIARLAAVRDQLELLAPDAGPPGHPPAALSGRANRPHERALDEQLPETAAP